MASPAERARRLWRRYGPAGVWRWARGSARRWRGARNFARKLWRDSTVIVRRRKRTREEIIKRLHHLRDRLVALDKLRIETRREIERAKRDGDAEEVERLRAKLDRVNDKDRALRKEQEGKRARRERNIAAAHQSIETRKWAFKARTIYARKFRRARRREQETGEVQYESWMANGHEGWNLTDRAKRLLAVAVVSFGLACTSITRSWGTGSHHEEVPTRGFDCAGARMTEFQRALRYGQIEGYAITDLLELFGPDNAACADNGQPYSMTEGSGIETLHDDHTHAFVYG